ncbi:MAG TPA: hypothetical protein VGT01_04355 [Candidatus Dormibacteraeota bacterium]|nr:hypothetical protein [Candidatus Dormibacteraeota bacterium]HEV2476839.1 hypothetical protein [Candidatus Dormibacteraeota bacterium]
MSDAELWAGLIALLAVVACLLVGLLLDGAYQVLTGRPSRIPLERHFLHRNPATELDCVRQGATKILQATALILIQVPNSLMLIRSTAYLTGLTPPPLGRLPAALDTLMFVGIFGSLGLALVLIGFAYGVGLKIKYQTVAMEASAL